MLPQGLASQAALRARTCYAAPRTRSFWLLTVVRAVLPCLNSENKAEEPSECLRTSHNNNLHNMYPLTFMNENNSDNDKNSSDKKKKKPPGYKAKRNHTEKKKYSRKGTPSVTSPPPHFYPPSENLICIYSLFRDYFFVTDITGLTF